MKKKEFASKLVVCNKCHWVGFQVSRQYAEDEVKKFNDYYDTLSPEKQELYYSNKKADIDFYEGCFRCDNTYKDFHDASEEEEKNVFGSTLNPTINRNE